MTESEGRGGGSWRSLRTVMLITVHVAVVAYAIRTFVRPTRLGPSLAVWMPITLGVALLLSWPMGKAIASAFDPDRERDLFRRRCPRCGQGDLRPLVRSARGVFGPVSGYRCASCWSTLRRVGDRLVEESRITSDRPVDASGIEFLGEAAVEGEVRFLDDDNRSTHPDIPGPRGGN